MSKLLQMRGGTTSQHNSFTGAVREVTVDTDKDTLVVHDGSTQGGFALPRTAAEVVALISNDSIDSQHYAAGSIDAEHLASDSVTEAKMAANSVDSQAYVDGSIDEVHLSDNSVDSRAYVDGSIDAIHMSANSIDSASYVDGSIDREHLAADIVDGTKIADDSINSEHIAADSIDAEHYAAGSVDTTALGADSVTTAKIADNVALGGSPTTTTQAESDDSTKIATTAYVVDKITTLIGGAPSTLNDLNELAAAINDDASYNSTLTTALGTKMPKAGGAFTGAVTTNSTIDGRDVAADGVLATNAMPKSGGAFTGAVTTNSTIDGRDVAADGVLATNALPKAGGTMTGDLDFGDSVDANFGAGTDLKIHSDGSTVYITGDDIRFRSKTGTESYFSLSVNGGISLRYDAVTKIATTAAGATVTGTLTADLADNSIDSKHYAAGSIDTEHIADSQITLGKMAVNSVNSGQYVDGSIDHVHLSANCIDGDNIGDNVIDSEHYAAGSIDAEHYAAGSVGGTALAANSVDSGELIDGSIDTSHFSANCITADEIGDNVLNSEHYAAGSIDAEHLASDSVTEAKVAANSIDSQAYVDGSIDTAHLGNLQVTGAKLAVDRRSTGTGTDIYSGNAHDYTFYDASIGIRWYTANAEDMRLEDDGDLHVDKDVIAFSTTISDERLKHDIEPITDALSKVGQLNGVTFTYNKDDKKSAGLIAQDVEKVLPSAVSEKELPLKHDDGIAYKVLQYDQTIGLLVEAIKELTAKVEKLENK